MAQRSKLGSHGTKNEGRKKRTNEGERMCGVENAKPLRKKSHGQDGSKTRNRCEINQGVWKQPQRGVMREDWEVRREFATSKAILGRCSFDYEGMKFSSGGSRKLCPARSRLLVVRKCVQT